MALFKCGFMRTNGCKCGQVVHKEGERCKIHDDAALERARVVAESELKHWILKDLLANDESVRESRKRAEHASRDASRLWDAAAKTRIELRDLERCASELANVDLLAKAVDALSRAAEATDAALASTLLAVAKEARSMHKQAERARLARLKAEDDFY